MAPRARQLSSLVPHNRASQPPRDAERPPKLQGGPATRWQSRPNTDPRAGSPRSDQQSSWHSLGQQIFFECLLCAQHCPRQQRDIGEQDMELREQTWLRPRWGGGQQWRRRAEGGGPGTERKRGECPDLILEGALCLPVQTGRMDRGDQMRGYGQTPGERLFKAE